MGICLHRECMEDQKVSIFLHKGKCSYDQKTGICLNGGECREY